MSPGIQMLEVAIGIKDSLMAAGFTSLDSLLRSNPDVDAWPSTRNRSSPSATTILSCASIAKLDAAKSAAVQYEIEKESDTADLPSE